MMADTITTINFCNGKASLFKKWFTLIDNSPTKKLYYTAVSIIPMCYISAAYADYYNDK